MSEVLTTDLGYHLPTSPRSYTIALSGTTVTVASVDGRVLREGQRWIWLVPALAAMLLLFLGAMFVSVRRRRRRAVLAQLSGIPVVIEDLVKEYGDGYRAVDVVSVQSLLVAALAFLLSVLTDAPLGAVGGATMLVVVSNILDSIDASTLIDVSCPPISSTRGWTRSRRMSYGTT